MSSSTAKHYGDGCARAVLSRGAILNIVNSNRNFGKTWLFKYRAVRRFFKHGKKTVWLRVFQDEATEAARRFFQSRDLRKKCGLVPWDKKAKIGNFRQEGPTIYFLKGGKWIPAIFVFALSQTGKARGADDVDIDTIVLDEYQKTPSQLRRYAGNPVTDFLDIFASIKREHEVRCFLLGNKESHGNPFLAAFGIAPPPASWEGVRLYKKGTICFQQINNAARVDAYESRVETLLEGTAYGAYMYDGQVKGGGIAKTKKAPPNAFLYAQISFDGCDFRILCDNATYYFVPRLDAGRAVFTNGDTTKWRQGRRLVNRSKNLFSALLDAFQMGRVYFATDALAEAVAPFLTFLGIR